MRALTFPVVLALTTACTSASAQDAAQTEAGELWHCFAHQAYYKENHAGLYPKSPSVSGKLVFHSVTPDEEWPSTADVEFTSLTLDPDVDHGIGVAAYVLPHRSDRIYVFAIIDGSKKLLGTYTYGTRIPYEIAFDDPTGTVRISSGQFHVEGRPEKLLRSSMYMKCVGSDVSFTV